MRARGGMITNPRATIRGVRPATLLCVSLLAAALTVVSLSAQTPAARRITTLAEVQSFSSFLHLRPVTVAGEVRLASDGRRTLTADGRESPLLGVTGAPDGPVEVRADVWDIGAMTADDPRVQALDLRRALGWLPDAPWPRRGTVVALVASAITPTPLPSTATLRAVALHPEHYRDQPVTLVGQFGARNVLGDLPDAPGRSRYDFVLRTAEAAVWVTGLRPKGKDVDLSLDSRLDVGRWVEVAGGIVEQQRGLVLLNAEGGRLRLVAAPTATSAPVEVPVVPLPPLDVVFSAPTSGETDVPLASTIRLQFSRDLAASTLTGRVHVRVGAADDGRDVPVSTRYLPGGRVLTITPETPLPADTPVTVELSDGILGTDGQRLTPWHLTFETGRD